MHFLLVNDDGIHAEGLAVLVRSISQIPNSNFTIVAPEFEQSQCGHRVTTATALELKGHGPNRFSVNGTPADCVRVALHHLQIQPDFVLSGINHGGNLGQDIIISGTVAAIREATYHGYRGIALSHYMIRERFMDWQRIETWTTRLLQDVLLQQEFDGHSFYNINYPHLAEGAEKMPSHVFTEPARSPLPVSFDSCMDGHTVRLQYTGRYNQRRQDPHSDVAVCFNDQISISRIGL